MTATAPGFQVKDVVDALDIHPFMLSHWRKEARDGLLFEHPQKPKPKRKPNAAKKPKRVRSRTPSLAQVSKIARLQNGSLHTGVGFKNRRGRIPLFFFLVSVYSDEEEGRG